VVDVFEEVDELVRSDRYKVFARRYLPWVGGVLAVALIAALGYWGYTRYQASAAQTASSAYALGLDTLGRGDLDQAYGAFAQAAKSPSRAYRSLALMQQAGVRIEQNRLPEAVKLFDEAAKAAPDLLLADSASLRAALTLMDTGDYAGAQARLGPLADPKRPYAAMAREALAMAKLATGQTNAARSDFVVLSLMADAPEATRNRARLAMGMIDSGALSNLPAIIKAARALPPPSPAAGLPPPGPPEAGSPDSQPSPAGAAQ
jgi:hypothetical protein